MKIYVVVKYTDVVSECGDETGDEVSTLLEAFTDHSEATSKVNLYNNENTSNRVRYDYVKVELN